MVRSKTAVTALKEMRRAHGAKTSRSGAGTPRLSVGWRRGAASAVIVLVLTGCATAGAGPSGFPAQGAPQALPAPRELAPATVQDFEGMLVGARGRPVVVNVWASWCGPCRVEAPLLQNAHRRYGDDVVLLGVVSKDAPGPALAFIDEFGLTYPNVLDDTGGIRNRLQLRGFPTTYIFGRDGRLTGQVLGGISEQALATAVSAALRDAR